MKKTWTNENTILETNCDRDAFCDEHLISAITTVFQVCVSSTHLRTVLQPAEDQGMQWPNTKGIRSSECPTAEESEECLQRLQCKS